MPAAEVDGAAERAGEVHHRAQDRDLALLLRPELRRVGLLRLGHREALDDLHRARGRVDLQPVADHAEVADEDLARRAARHRREGRRLRRGLLRAAEPVGVGPGGLALREPARGVVRNRSAAAAAEEIDRLLRGRPQVPALVRGDVVEVVPGLEEGHARERPGHAVDGRRVGRDHDHPAVGKGDDGCVCGGTDGCVGGGTYGCVCGGTDGCVCGRRSSTIGDELFHVAAAGGAGRDHEKAKAREKPHGTGVGATAMPA